MPDIFASVGLISVALLFGYADRMSISERLGLTALLAISAVFHITHLMTAAVVGFAGLAATFGPTAMVGVSRRRKTNTTSITRSTVAPRVSCMSCTLARTPLTLASATPSI
jgi:hypothetical protein